MTSRTLTVEDIARYCRVSQFTVHKWVQQERLSAFKTPSGQFLVPVHEFLAFVRMQGLPVDNLYFSNGGTAKRVLIVNAEEEVLEFFARSLCQSSSAIHLFSAHNWSEARCQVTAVNPDLIIQCPATPPRPRSAVAENAGRTLAQPAPANSDPEGAEFRRWLKQNPALQHIKILAIADAQAHDRLPQAGVDGIVQQPLDSRTVHKKVHELLGRSGSMAA